MTFSGKMWLLIILKVTKKTGFHPPFRRYTFQKPQRGAVKFTPSRFRVNRTAMNDCCLRRLSESFLYRWGSISLPFEACSKRSRWQRWVQLAPGLWLLVQKWLSVSLHGYTMGTTGWCRWKEWLFEGSYITGGYMLIITTNYTRRVCIITVRKYAFEDNNKTTETKPMVILVSLLLSLKEAILICVKVFKNGLRKICGRQPKCEMIWSV